jgi:heterotetrameric sarcosine oxidase gamma subunit
MTAITPLESVHKKGLFGDHHKKNEKDLLTISEIENLSIIQIVKFKNSKINIKTIKIDGLEFPLENSNVTCDHKTRILSTGPNTWLVMSKKEDIVNFIKQECRIEDFALTDISHSRAIIQIVGLQAREVLKKGCPINFNEFKKNNCAGSVFNGINIVVDCIDNEKQIYNVFTLRSFGESLHHHITDSCLEFGYLGI